MQTKLRWHFVNPLPMSVTYYYAFCRNKISFSFFFYIFLHSFHIFIYARKEKNFSWKNSMRRFFLLLFKICRKITYLFHALKKTKFCSILVRLPTVTSCIYCKLQVFNFKLQALNVLHDEWFAFVQWFSSSI